MVRTVAARQASRYSCWCPKKLRRDSAAKRTDCCSQTQTQTHQQPSCSTYFTARRSLSDWPPSQETADLSEHLTELEHELFRIGGLGALRCGRNCVNQHILYRQWREAKSACRGIDIAEMCGDWKPTGKDSSNRLRNLFTVNGVI
jgi:hypothetical protein